MENILFPRSQSASSSGSRVQFLEAAERAQASSSDESDRINISVSPQMDVEVITPPNALQAIAADVTTAAADAVSNAMDAVSNAIVITPPNALQTIAADVTTAAADAVSNAMDAVSNAITDLPKCWVPTKNMTAEELLAEGLPIEEYCRRKERELSEINKPYKFTIVAEKVFNEGDLVWAKMKGYAPWPGKIITPLKPKKHYHRVFFFVSENHAMIPDEDIQVHNEKLVEKYGNRKGEFFQKSVRAIIAQSKTITKKPSCENNSGKSSNREVSSKTKSFPSNSTPKKFKKLPLKKRSPVEKPSLAKTTHHASDQSDPDNDNDNRITNESYFPNILRFDNNCDQVMMGVRHRKYQERPDTPPIILRYQSEALKKKKIEPTSKKIGFLGLGKLGQGIVKNLYLTNHTIILWNDPFDVYECQYFAEKLGIQILDTPADVIKAADITFCCISDADVAKKIVFKNSGILEGLNGERKCYVQMTTMDPECSKAICYEIEKKGGCYLEAPLGGSRIDAIEGTLIVLAAGHKTLYDECKSCFDAISKRHLFVNNEVGTATKLILVHNMLASTIYASVAEALAFVIQIPFDGKDFLNILKDTAINSENIFNKGMAMIKNEYMCNTPMKQVDQHFQLGLSFAGQAQPTSIFSAVHELYKRCICKNYGDHDVSAVFENMF